MTPVLPQGGAGTSRAAPLPAGLPHRRRGQGQRLGPGLGGGIELQRLGGEGQVQEEAVVHFSLAPAAAAARGRPAFFFQHGQTQEQGRPATRDGGVTL